MAGGTEASPERMRRDPPTACSRGACVRLYPQLIGACRDCIRMLHVMNGHARRLQCFPQEAIGVSHKPDLIVQVAAYVLLVELR